LYTILTNYFQTIKKDNERTVSCKIALYREFLKCGMKTWEQVIKALEMSGHGNIAEEVTMKLFKIYNEVMDHYGCFLIYYNNIYSYIISST